MKRNFKLKTILSIFMIGVLFFASTPSGLIYAENNSTIIENSGDELKEGTISWNKNVHRIGDEVIAYIDDLGYENKTNSISSYGIVFNNYEREDIPSDNVFYMNSWNYRK